MLMLWEPGDRRWPGLRSVPVFGSASGGRACFRSCIWRFAGSSIWRFCSGRSREGKEVEILVLRHELGVLRRCAVRSRYEARDRTLLAALRRLLPRERWGGVRVTPETLLRRHARMVKRG